MESASGWRAGFESLGPFCVALGLAHNEKATEKRKVSILTHVISGMCNRREESEAEWLRRSRSNVCCLYYTIRPNSAVLLAISVGSSLPE